jgi:hypothetical protein
MLATTPIDERLLTLHAAALAEGISADEFAKTKVSRRWTWQFLVSHALSTNRSWRHEDEEAEIQTRWDQRRMERATAKATGPSRKQGRL